MFQLYKTKHIAQFCIGCSVTKGATKSLFLGDILEIAYLKSLDLSTDQIKANRMTKKQFKWMGFYSRNMDNFRHLRDDSLVLYLPAVHYALMVQMMAKIHNVFNITISNTNRKSCAPNFR